jgi:hypothetical protein
VTTKATGHNRIEPLLRLWGIGHAASLGGMGFVFRKESASPVTEMTMMTREMISSVKRDGQFGGGCPTTCAGQPVEAVTLKINNARPISRLIIDNILSRVRSLNLAVPVALKLGSKGVRTICLCPEPPLLPSLRRPVLLRPF